MSLTWRACRVAPEVVLVVVLPLAMVAAEEVLVILALLVVEVEVVLLAIIVMVVVVPVDDMLNPCSSWTRSMGSPRPHDDLRPHPLGQAASC